MKTALIFCFLIGASAIADEGPAPSAGVAAACNAAIGKLGDAGLAHATAEADALVVAAKGVKFDSLVQLLDKCRRFTEAKAREGLKRFNAATGESQAVQLLKGLRNSLTSEATVCALGTQVTSIPINFKFVSGNPNEGMIDMTFCSAAAKVQRREAHGVVRTRLFTEGSAAVSVCAKMVFSSAAPEKMHVEYSLVHTGLERPALADNVLLKFADRLPLDDAAYMALLETSLKPELRKIERSDYWSARAGASGAEALPPICERVVQQARATARTLDLAQTDEDAGQKGVLSPGQQSSVKAQTSPSRAAASPPRGVR